MNHRELQSGSILVRSVGSLIKHAFRISIIALAYTMKFSGLFLTRIGETVESIIVKTHR